MNNNKNSYDHITVVLDRSGSMQSIKQDVIGGFNNFLNQQKSLARKTTFTFIQFDTINSYEVVYDNVDINNVNELTDNTFKPRGGTPLLDCLGAAITNLDRELNALADDDKPGKVFFIIITDGQENSSREYKKDVIVKMIDEKKKQGWEFLFLSADLNAINDAMKYGFVKNGVLFFSKEPREINKAFNKMSGAIMNARMREDYKIDLNTDEFDI